MSGSLARVASIAPTRGRLILETDFFYRSWGFERTLQALFHWGALDVVSREEYSRDVRGHPEAVDLGGRVGWKVSALRRR